MQHPLAPMTGSMKRTHLAALATGCSPVRPPSAPTPLPELAAIFEQDIAIPNGGGAGPLLAPALEPGANQPSTSARTCNSDPLCFPPEVWLRILGYTSLRTVLPMRGVCQGMQDICDTTLVQTLLRSCVRVGVPFSEAFPFNPAIEGRRRALLREWTLKTEIARVRDNTQSLGQLQLPVVQHPVAQQPGQLPRRPAISQIATASNAYPVPPIPTHPSFSSILFTRGINLRCIGLRGRDGPLSEWRVRYAVDPPHPGVGHDARSTAACDENERMIIQGGMFDFAQQHKCGFTTTPSLVNTPRPSVRASTWADTAKAAIMPALADLRQCHRALGIPVPQDNADGQPPPPPPYPVSRDPCSGHFLVSIAANGCTLHMTVLDKLPRVGLATSNTSDNDEQSSAAPPPPPPLRPTNFVDPVLASSVLDRLGYHVDAAILQSQNHEWFGVLREVECDLAFLCRYLPRVDK